MHQADSVADVASKTASLRFPLIVKPDSQGSSLGLGIARTGDELQSAVKAAARGGSDTFAIVEPFILGLRVHGGNPRPPDALPLLGALSHRRACSITEAKYESAITEYPVRPLGLLPSETVAEIEHAAVSGRRGRF